MKETNHEIISKGFRLLLSGLAPYITKELKAEYGQDWWQEGVLNELYEDQKRDLPLTSDDKTLTNSLDIHRCLLLFSEIHWQYIFRKKLSKNHRTWAKELSEFRNRLAHLAGEDFSDDDTWRALDTMSRLCENISFENTENIRVLLRYLRYGAKAVETKETDKKNIGVLNTKISGLPSWRDVISPHPDVREGRYKNAEFAADLSQVIRGEGANEYRDPVEFFKRTYITEGIKGLLVQSLKRVSGQDGDPVIQLKTAFGGGKTHSMLALYHLMRGRISLEKLPELKSVLSKAGLTQLPKVHVAVIVGTSIDPTKSRRPQNFPGITINTLWGEIAAQLAESAGNPKLYDYIKESDKNRVSPGSNTLKELFDSCGSCLILIDEIVAYGRKLGNNNNLPAGTFDNFISFIQEITEAARASKNSMAVAAIPESSIEIGGENGQKVLKAIEHTFGRMESIWKPVAANEGFEVVRRRLFLDCKDENKRSLVADSFSKMYRENQSDFPIETQELDYRNRILSCYPIHPEIFDRLYEDWATLEKFQRTRGVLRLMAAVIHELWMGNDTSALIMPGSIALNISNVRDELIRYLPEGWNAIIDKEIDGKNSIPYKKDMEIARFGNKLATRRVARTIMLGSAPTNKAQTVRGIEKNRIRLGIIQPDENIADFNDALGSLQSAAAYLYTDSSGNRFWYDTRPTLKKTVDDRATQISQAEIEQEIKIRLGKIRNEKPFCGIHICPSSSLDVPDEQKTRIVLLGQNEEYSSSKKENNAAVKSCEEILNNRGNSPRIYRNMLAFIAPDAEQKSGLDKEVRFYLAWKSIEENSKVLGLDLTQNEEVKVHVKKCSDSVDLKIQETWCWLIIPTIDKDNDIKNIMWEFYKLNGNTDSIISKAAKNMEKNETLITQWAPFILKMELDNLLWKDKDDIAVKTLWEQLCSYCYLPRLANYEVLETAIIDGVNSENYFALAESKNEDGKYFDIKYNCSLSKVNQSSYLIKKETAQEALKKEIPDQPVIDNDNTGEEMQETSQPERRTNRFSLTAPLDNTLRINRDVSNLVENIINHLTAVENSKMKISLEINMTAPEIPQSVIRTVSENCKTLKITNFQFNED